MTADPATLRAGFRLGEWLVKPEDGSLASPNAARRLEPLAVDLLVFLCSQAGRVVTKEEVVRAAWGGRFVSDETIKGVFHHLRKALADDPRHPRFIETLPKRGYRLLAVPQPLQTASPGLRNRAEEACRKGQAALSARPSPDSLKQARLYFERAIEVDPASAPALSGLALTFVLMADLGLGTGSELLPRAKAAAARALELDPSSAQARLALGVVHFVLDVDARAAARDFRLAGRLAPQDSLIPRWHARLLASQGRGKQAVEQARRAVEVESLSLGARRDLLEMLVLARRYEDAIAEAHHLFEIAPASPDAQLGMAWVYHLQKRDSDAFASFLAGLRQMGIAEARQKMVEAEFQRGGMSAVFSLWARVLESEAEMGQKNQSDLLVLYALLGEKDRCFRLLESARRDRNPHLLWLVASPYFDSLRADPRFRRFLKYLGLPASR